MKAHLEITEDDLKIAMVVSQIPTTNPSSWRTSCKEVDACRVRRFPALNDCTGLEAFARG